MNAHETIHAGCVLVGEAGLLIRGASGSGKSALAREVVSLALGTGRFGRLVSDDRTRLEAQSLCDTFEGRDAWLASGMEVGVEQGYAKLDRLLEDHAV